MRSAPTALCGRPSMVGDNVMSLVVPAFLRSHYGDVFVNWVVAKKCSQAAPLYIGHDLIDRIHVSSTDDGYGPELLELAKFTDMVFDPAPQHPTGDGWVNEEGINIYSETFRMAGLPLHLYRSLLLEDQIPRLYPWFKTEFHPKSIAIWPGARQGEKENRRVPPHSWWLDLSIRLGQEGYVVYHCGHPNEFAGHCPLGDDVRHKSFMDLIALSLGCDAIIGTDSGSMVALAAYQSTPTLSLLCPHWPGHTTNPLCFGPLGKRHRNMWAATHNGHLVEDVVAAVKEMT